MAYDRYGGGASSDYDRAPLDGDEPTDSEDLFARLKCWFKDDYEASDEWRTAATEDFAFVAGEQWTEEDKAKLREQLRPIITMNRIDPIIDSVSGSEVANRQEVRYIPREQGDVKVNELLTSAAQWFRDECDAEDEESDAFRDALVCGMGWTETRLSYDENPDGKPLIERVDPLAMVWDCTASKRNLADGRRLFHIRRNVPIDEARGLIPGDFDDEDYDATWVDDDDSRSGTKHSNPTNTYTGDNDAKGSAYSKEDRKVTLVRCQWWEREPIFRLVDPSNPGNIITLSIDEYKDWLTKAQIAGAMGIKAVRGMKRVYRQAYLGNVLLDVGDAPCKEHFSFMAITGKRDRNKNDWYGLVRGMKDPQRWANKWLSQSLHILNTSAKGGILAERGAFEDDRDAEMSWAKQESITWAKPGALSGQAPKINPKPQSQFPSGFYQLMNFAISSIRDVSGVNIEMLGMREAAQAASLEMQRRQSSMTILQPLFDGLRRYRKAQGRVMLYIIQHYLSDGRLVRIVGQDQAQFVPLIRQTDNCEYDTVVDDAPTSPNQKEQTWAILQQLLPAVGKIMPPQTWIALLEYSPLPTTAQDKIKKSIAEATQNQQPDPELVKAQNMMAIEKQRSEQDLLLAQAKAQSEAAIDQQRMEHQAVLERQRSEHDIEIKRAQAAADALLQQQKMQQEQAHARAKLEAEIALETYKAELMAKVELAKPPKQSKAK